MIDTKKAAEPKTPRDEDARWIKMITEGGRQENIAVNEIFDRHKNMVISYVQQNSGRKEDAEEVFMEAILAITLDVHDKKFRGEVSLKNYLMAIVRHLWINQLRKTGRYQTHIDAMMAEDAAAPLQYTEPPKELELIRDTKLRVLLRTLAKLYQGCLDIFKMFYWYDWSYKKIANLLGYPSEASVKVKKMRCMSELERFLDKNPSLKAFLREG